MRILILLFLFLFASLANAENILNLYSWSGYLPSDVALQFERETGVHINYTTFNSNETMYAKLKANPASEYDVVVPSTYFIDRMWRQGMLQKIDKTKIKQLENINPLLMNKSFDPENNYSIPFSWGTTGIVINKKFIDQNSVRSWADFWQPQFKNQLLLLDDPRETFAIALMTLGYSVNETNPDHIKAAYHKLQQLMPNVKLFNDEAIQSIYIDEDAKIGMGWSGEIYQAIQENSSLDYIYPKEGFCIWVDSLAIPIGAKHVENAYKFINFILRPEIAKQISLETGYPSPNLVAVKLLPSAIKNNLIIYPTADVLRHGQMQIDVGSAGAVYEKYMGLLKIEG